MYNWDGKEEECYRLYVEEKKSLDEVIQYWDERGFTPSKRVFRNQFKKWDFPKKQHPAHKNEALTARIKELWEKNCTQKDMLDLLQAEGFEINDRELVRVRLRFNWYLRESRSKGPRKAKAKAKAKKKTVVLAGNNLIDQLASAILQRENTSSEEDTDDASDAQEEVPSEEPEAQTSEQVTQPLSEEEVVRRQLRQQQLQIESDEKWRTKKRRRRTRGWAGLPADAPGEPPRFPSETTIDESKAFLGLDNRSYKQMRDEFQVICEEEGVSKKTIAGPEKWNQLLQRVVRENAYLANVFQHEPESLSHVDTTWRPKGSKALPLDVICQDVTKRMRVAGSRMGMSEAKTVLGLNPEQTRQTRNAFLAILQADNFTTKGELGDERWAQLKQQWVQESEVLSRLAAPEELPVGSEPGRQHSRTIKAIEALARDVMKRHRSQLAKQDASGQKLPHKGPGPGPAPPSMPSQASRSSLNARESQSAANSRSVRESSSTAPVSAESDSQIDPSLLLAASDAAFLTPNSASAHQFSHTTRQQEPRISRSFTDPTSREYRTNTYNTPTQLQSSTFLRNTPAPLPIYYRLHPHSTTPFPTKMVWLSVLQSSTLAEVKALALREHPGTMVLRMEGLIVHRAEGLEREIAIPVDDDAELNAFLGHVQGGKATFVVLLAAGGAGSGFA